MQSTTPRPRVSLMLGDDQIVPHVGARLLLDVSDRLGLTAALSAAVAGTKRRQRGHDRGQMLTHVAAAIADGATTFTDWEVLARQPAVFGAVASVATLWRTLRALDTAAWDRVAAARAAARRQAWAAGLDPGYYVIDIDGTLVTAHSEKEGAAPTYKRGFGFYPLVAFLDATGEPLAGILRPGNAGSGTATDHIALLDAALAQLPVDPHATEVIVRADSAGCSHKFLAHCTTRGVRFCVGHPLTAELATVILDHPRLRWIPALTADGTAERAVGEVAELTRWVDLTGWPPGTRLIVRREIPHPGAQLTFTDVRGYRYQLCLTNAPDADVAYLEALYRGRGRCEQAIRDLKATGLTHLPSESFTQNAAWLTAVLMAGDLLAWLKGLCLPEPLRRAEPPRLRYTLLHVPARRIRSGRRTILRIPRTWPWAEALVTAFARCVGLPRPAPAVG